MTSTHPHTATDSFVAAVFAHDEATIRSIEQLIEHDFPMDQISLLRRAGGMGDDPIGVAYDSPGERMKVWGRHGAFWGALWGLLAGAAGLFVLPGIGPVVAAGPIIEALVGAITGTTLSGGVMAGAAALTQFAQVLHQAGLPPEDIKALHQSILDGDTVLLLHCTSAEAGRHAYRLGDAGAHDVRILRRRSPGDSTSTHGSLGA